MKRLSALFLMALLSVTAVGCDSQSSHTVVTELIDLTTGESVFKAFANNYPDQGAVEKIPKYSSTEGIPILRDHDYEVVAVYNNTTDQEVDSMAVVYLYLHDAKWNIPQRKRST